MTGSGTIAIVRSSSEGAARSRVREGSVAGQRSGFPVRSQREATTTLKTRDESVGSIARNSPSPGREGLCRSHTSLIWFVRTDATELSPVGLDALSGQARSRARRVHLSEMARVRSACDGPTWVWQPSTRDWAEMEEARIVAESFVRVSRSTVLADESAREAAVRSAMVKPMAMTTSMMEKPLRARMMATVRESRHRARRQCACVG